MHELEHGALAHGRGGKVETRAQAIAIALHEAGASEAESPATSRENLRKSGHRRSRRA